ncbi:CCP1 [Candida jiufengensis]|uniref:CCP1 n=1 Tax=Candida jiufengensis TaxID=497108 RepID=UPI002224CC21|nr:CCP1 [Candida jiufengensis]KAI5953471.1 CCP1 [Candida jiufengensis]
MFWEELIKVIWFNFDGPWSPQAYLFTNDFYENLMQNWHVRPPPWSGNKQYQDDETNELMMTPSDMTLKEYPEFLKYTKIYAKDQDAWFRDFAPAYTKLLELGITYPEDQKPMVFKTLDEQAN